MIYISSIAFAGLSPKETATLAAENQFPFEFSSGMSPDPKLLEYFFDYPQPKLAHNYFPAPETPFVLNLASKDAAIRQISIDHCIQGLEISKKVGAPFFCAHAGFCLDPDPNELGKKLKQSTTLIDREEHWTIFQESVNYILAKADALSIDFYIENNVTAKMNLNVHGQNPLLCSHYKEMARLFEEIEHPRLGLLLDTAHLKVSSCTLLFDLEEAIKKLTPFVKAIHHSDNDGLLDSNQPIEKNYWFAVFMPRFRNMPQVLEVKKQSIVEIKEQVGLLSSFALGNK